MYLCNHISIEKHTGGHIQGHQLGLLGDVESDLSKVRVGGV